MTESEWRNVDESFIKKMEAMDNRTLVDRLWQGDDDAWRFVYARAVIPLLHSPVLGGMARDFQRSDLDVCGAVYDYLIAQKKLEQYKGYNNCPVVMWIRYWVAKDIRLYCRKNGKGASDEGLEDVLVDGKDAFARNEFKEEVNLCYRKLRQANLTMARVLYLKVRENRPSQEVAKLLSLSRENVDTLYSRARRRMKEYLIDSRKVKVSVTNKRSAKEVSV